MSTLNELIEQIENPELRKRIADEVTKLNKQKKFGLVFEEHLPECTTQGDGSAVFYISNTVYTKKTSENSEVFLLIGFVKITYRKVQPIFQDERGVLLQFQLLC